MNTPIVCSSVDRQDQMESYGTELLFETAKDNIPSQNNNDKGRT